MLLNCSIAKRAVLAVLQLSAKTESDESILHTAFYNITRTHAKNVYMYYIDIDKTLLLHACLESCDFLSVTRKVISEFPQENRGPLLPSFSYR